MLLPFKIDSNGARRNRFWRCCIMKHRRLGLHQRRRIIPLEIMSQIGQHLRSRQEDIGECSLRRRGRPRRPPVGQHLSARPEAVGECSRRRRGRPRRADAHQLTGVGNEEPIPKETNDPEAVGECSRRRRGRPRRADAHQLTCVGNEEPIPKETNDNMTTANTGLRTQVLLSNEPNVSLATPCTRSKVSRPRSRTQHEEIGESSSRTKVRRLRPTSNPLATGADIESLPMTTNNIDLLTDETGVHVEELDANVAPLSSVPTRTRKFLTPWSFGKPDALCDFCNAVVWSKESVGRRTKKGRLKFNICCQKGKVKLPLRQDPPNFLKELLDPNGGTCSREFKRLIRSYNIIFAFTSMGGWIDKAINNGSGPYCFRLGGQNHHNIGSLLPPEGKQPRFMQLYFHETDKEVTNRISSLDSTGRSELDPDIVEGLHKMIYEHNPLAKVCKMARERINPSNLHPVRLRLIASRNKDGRQYNLPTTDEIAGLIVGVGDNEKGNRDIIIDERSRGLRRISELHPSFMSLQYPLIFPYGEDGYRTKIKHRDAETTKRRKRKTVSMREFYVFQIHERRKDGKLIDGMSVLCGRLRQQFIVDAFTCVEETRLDYIRRHQKDIRKYTLRGLVDAVTAGEITPASLGQRMILPPSFPGCFRFLFQHYQDALAICRWAGPPDLFITFTCNSKWDEITEFLSAIPGQRPEDRPDVVSRVFKIKLDELMADITKNAFFGRVLAVVYTIEFQKRGLPHAHICIFLRPEDKHPEPADIDIIISAELPDPLQDPVGYEAVMQFMVHGPCGQMNSKSPCMSDGKCSKYYPRKFQNSTSVTEDGYLEYRRREDGRTGEINGHTIDNRFVVPHNIDLLVKYQAHLNVEWCNKHRSIKYLFKYMSKGHDMSLASIHQMPNNASDLNDKEKPIDEIEMYLRCRYVSASEACWRLFGFEIQYKRPPVQRLCYHLLNTTKGATSFADIRTINGIVHPTFKAACNELGLLDGDDEWHIALTEAASWSTAHQLRELFTTLLLYCEVSDPRQLWLTHWRNLSDDILPRQRRRLGSRDLTLTDEQLQNYALHELELILNRANRSLCHFADFPTPDKSLLLNSGNRLILVEQNYDRKLLKLEAEKLEQGLNEDQKQVHQKVLAAVYQNTGGVFFVNGRGGTGKTYLWTTLISRLRSEGKIVLAVASSGIAALLLSSGRTAHSRFAIPINLSESTSCRIEQGSDLAQLIQQASLIIWDEAPMVHRHAFEAVDRAFRDVMQLQDPTSSEKVFGGKTVVLGGDFRQILPVVPRKGRGEIVDASITKSSQIWPHCTVLKLQKNMRLLNSQDEQMAKEIEQFSKWVLDIGDGKIAAIARNEEDDKTWIHIPKDILITNQEEPIPAIVNEIYPDLIVNYSNPSYLRERAILAPKNETVDEINNYMLRLIPGIEEISKSADRICPLTRYDGNMDNLYPPEFLNSLQFQGLPNHELILKVGCPVILLRNLNQASGMCNGTRLIVTRICPKVIEGKVITGTNVGQTVAIPRIEMTPNDTNWPFTLKRRQFPIKVCFAMTINKSQGQTFNKVVLLARSCFYSWPTICGCFKSHISQRSEDLCPR